LSAGAAYNVGMRILSIVLATVTAIRAQAPPDPEQLQELINRARASAMRYQGHLPDFNCTKVTDRWEDSSGTGNKWKKRDTLEEAVAFGRSGQTLMKVLKINGEPSTRNRGRLGGVIEDSLLAGAIVPEGVFGRQAQAELEWDGWQMRGGRRIAVLDFRGKGVNYPDGKTGWELKVTGKLFFDPSTVDVVRIEVSQVGPPGYPFKESGWTMDYAPQVLSGRELVLPVSGVSHSTRGRTLFRNEIRYVDYRKYDTESSIRFEDSK
jgi:hypothetical protein